MGKRNVKYANHCVASLLTETDDIANFWNLEAIGIIDTRECKNGEVLKQSALHNFRIRVHNNDDD